jgi:hypothetical protein
MSGIRLGRKKSLLVERGPDSLEQIAIVVPHVVTGLDRSQVKGMSVETSWLVWPKNGSGLALLPQPSTSQDENVGWTQRLQIPIAGGKIVMENTPAGVPAEMHYAPNAQSQKAGERQFLFVANEIDLGRKSTVVEFVNSTRIAIAGMHGLLVENGEEVALSLFGFPYTLDYSLDNILRRIRSVSVQDAARAFRIQSLINTSQPSKALAQIEELSTRQGTIYTDSLIDELKAELVEQNKRLRTRDVHTLQLFK